MSYWTVIPTAVINDARLTNDEKILYLKIRSRLNPAGYCTDSNEELGRMLGKSPKTISLWINGLRQKKFANVVLNFRKHRRQIYLSVPFEQPLQEEPIPEGEKLNEVTERLRSSLKQAIVFGTIDFKVLVEKLLESPYLENVKDNDIQFALNSDQVKFLAMFKEYFSKTVDCQIACYPNIDYDKLIDHLLQSTFIKQNSNLTLKWCLEHSEEIIQDNFKDYENTKCLHRLGSNFSSRNYTREELNSVFQNIDEIVI